MNVNSSADASIKLHRAYNWCLQERMKVFLANTESEEQTKEQEWCPNEKHAYFEHMRVNLPV